MGVMLKRPIKGICWICGKSGNLTREHKFKASDIRRQFGSDQMVVGVWGSEHISLRPAQGPNAKSLKYKSDICLNCNSAGSQKADKAYDKFISKLEFLSVTNQPLQRIFQLYELDGGFNANIDLFRYFAKLLGCHLADYGGPILRYLSLFVSNKIDFNRISLGVDIDDTYIKILEMSNGDLSHYGAHGGIEVLCNRSSLRIERIQSSLTVHRIRMFFFIEVHFLEYFEMKIRYKKFIDESVAAFKVALRDSERMKNT